MGETLTKTCESVNNADVEKLFHWNTEPEDKTEDCKDVGFHKVKLASSVVSIVDFFVELLQDFLDDPNNINNDYIRDLVTKKKIDVSAMSDFDTDTAGDTPRIIVEFSGKQAQQNFAFGNKINYNIHNSSTDYYSHWQIGISLYIVGNTLNETLLLAEEVSNFCHCFQEDICEAAGFLRCQIAEMSKPQCLTDGGTQRGYLNTVSLTVITPYSWTITRSAPVLKRITLGTDTHI